LPSIGALYQSYLALSCSATLPLDASQRAVT
jgi:hypothetical protein